MDLDFIINNLEDLEVLHPDQIRSYSAQYQSIARDEKLSKIAIEKCESIFHQWSLKKNINVEVLNRCKDLWLAAKGRDSSLPEFPYSNLTIEQIDVKQYIENQEKDSMKNLTIEEVEVTDYI